MSLWRYADLLPAAPPEDSGSGPGLTPLVPAPRLAAALGVGEIFLKLGNEKEGLRWLYSALQQDPGHRPTHQALRDHFRSKGQPERAAAHEKALGKE